MQAIYASAAMAGVMLGLLFAGILKLIRVNTKYIAANLSDTGLID
jgi:hypothetical protein